MTSMAENLENFPTPIIYKCTIKRVNILVNNVKEKVEVIISESGAIYEKGRLLKKSIFGYVIHATLICSDPNMADLYMRTNHQMAIKIYYSSLLKKLQGHTEENPFRETSALQFIGRSHISLLGQIECCTDNENVYSVMRYYEGNELFDVINENGPMSEDQARHVFKQLLDALEDLQKLGIAHRDISLENLLYNGDNITVIDFGMCIRCPRSNITNSFEEITRLPVCGKLNYIAPEVINRKQTFNPMLCDIWASGIILFMILTQSPPMEVASQDDTRFRMISEGKLKELLKLIKIDYLSEDVIDLIQRILNPDPNQRITIEEMKNHRWLNRNNKYPILRLLRDRRGNNTSRGSETGIKGYNRS